MVAMGLQVMKIMKLKIQQFKINQKLKQLETSRYFRCLNCGRNIAGGRFASHISKCLERKRK